MHGKMINFSLLAAIGVMLAGCGNTPGERALTGGAIGAGAGAIVGGAAGAPVTGALVGAGAGAVGGAVTAPR